MDMANNVACNVNLPRLSPPGRWPALARIVNCTAGHEDNFQMVQVPAVKTCLMKELAGGSSGTGWKFQKKKSCFANETLGPDIRRSQRFGFFLLFGANQVCNRWAKPL